jgi:hypothetical protein
METERFAVPEVLFCPSDVGINQVCITMIIPLIQFLFPLECLEVIDGFHSSWFYSHSFEQLFQFFCLYPQAGVAESVWQSLKSLQQVKVYK